MKLKKVLDNNSQMDYYKYNEGMIVKMTIIKTERMEFFFGIPRGHFRKKGGFYDRRRISRIV